MLHYKLEIKRPATTCHGEFETLKPRNIWPETTVTYPPALREAYRQGTLFRKRCSEYSGHLLFCDRMLESQQIPRSGPVANPMFFNELFVGTKYLDAGYEALFFYREVEDRRCYEQACELLGGSSAARFITPNSERDGRAPDLLVFETATKQFRFVECKGLAEPFTKSQPRRFAGIEQYLNQASRAHGAVLTDPQRPDLVSNSSKGFLDSHCSCAPDGRYVGAGRLTCA